MKSDIYKQLEEAGIYGPGSEELEKYEEHLIRYFEREYKHYRDNPVTLESLGISTSQGPMMSETEALMEHHYDEKPEFFDSFLDSKYHAYSMAYYGDHPSEILNSPLTLEQAQEAKFSLIAERAQIKGNERILNIGCGFGSLETFLFEKFPEIEITGITPSKVQIKHLRKRMEDKNDYLGRYNFYLFEGSFNDFILEVGIENKFDLIISIAVFEQVYNMKDILFNISRYLSSDGKTFHHFITSQCLVPRFINPEKTRIGNYFPGGRVWPHHELTKHINYLDLESIWFVNGLNYWRTLTEWHKRFWNNLGKLYDDTFSLSEIIYWNKYFYLSKALFSPLDGTFYGNSHYLFTKK